MWWICLDDDGLVVIHKLGEEAKKAMGVVGRCDLPYWECFEPSKQVEIGKRYFEIPESS